MKNLNILILQGVILLLSIVACKAFLPGVSPREYEIGSPIALKVNSLTSSHTQLPYDYYSLPFCRPPKIEEASENLGEILSGDKIENSPYVITAGIETSCQLLCIQDLTPAELGEFVEKIHDSYRVQWLLDNLPVATAKTLVDKNGVKTTIYESGFLLGRKGKELINGEDDKAYLHNHVQMIIFYNKNPVDQKIRIVGFEVEPSSIQYGQDATPETIKVLCENNEIKLPQQVNLQSQTKIPFTYSVLWRPKDIKWASRWDVYVLMVDDEIHWFSIINSLLIVLFLSGTVALILFRILSADLKKYSELEEQEEATGWKLIHGDVFRPPKNGMLLSALCGTGIQLFAMLVVTLVTSFFGISSPANRGSLLTALVVLFVLMGFLAGYFSARLYLFLHGQLWKELVVLTAVLFPGTLFILFFVLNGVLVYEGSSGAVHFGTMIALLALWFGVSAPLVSLGSYFAFKKPPEENRVRINPVPHQIPEQHWYAHPIFTILVGGILPFGAVFIELFFILSSIWLHEFYYLFGFMVIVFIILIVTCAEMSIVMCYIQLCYEDYNWWWRAYLTSGASAFYMFLYSIFYFFTKLQINKFASMILYFGYTTIFVICFFVLTGTIGFYSCFLFVKKIYNSIKFD